MRDTPEPMLLVFFAGLAVMGALTAGYTPGASVGIMTVTVCPSTTHSTASITQAWTRKFSG